MVELPNSVEVGPYVYTFELTHKKTSDPIEDFGKTDLHRHRIFVASEQAPLSVKDTVLHEVMHAVWDQMKIDREKHEEPVVSALSTGLLDVLRRNPELVSYLTS